MRCRGCAKQLEKVDEMTWICIPCRVTEYFVEGQRDHDTCDTRMTG